MKKILVADDDIEICKLIENILSDKGYEVFSARNGKEALKRLYNISPDIMILDVEMPEINGDEVYRTIRKDEFYKDLPILMMSGSTPYNENADFQIDKEFLSKPFDIKDLLYKVEFLLKEFNAKQEEE